MREIEFRGKTKSGEWVKGSYVYAHKWFGSGEAGHFITSIYGDNRMLVEKETVGQYTGLRDKNGVEIYEGDIVRIKYAFGIFEDAITVVKYHETHCKFVLHVPGKQYYFMFADNMGIGKFTNGIEVIGNIYDNPELLEDKA